MPGPASLWEWDDILFARALHRYDLVAHSPHPPGFPVFVVLARAAFAIPDRANVAKMIADRRAAAIHGERRRAGPCAADPALTAELRAVFAEPLQTVSALGDVPRVRAAGPAPRPRGQGLLTGRPVGSGPCLT